PRNQLVTRTLARLLRHAGVDFGILYDAERNAGCDVRRVGEEGLFNHLREENVAAISKCEFDRILTWDPHSFHTLRNEYSAVGVGRSWMTELKREDAPRPSEQRIDEAVALGGIDYFVVCCPKDVTMYEDAIKTSGHQGEIELRELTELVWESLGRSAEGGRNGKEQQV